MWDGGVKRAQVIGETADERPFRAITEPILIDQIHQSEYRALGIPAEMNYVIEGRPFYTTPDGLGEQLPDFFS